MAFLFFTIFRGIVLFMYHTYHISILFYTSYFTSLVYIFEFVFYCFILFFSAPDFVTSDWLILVTRRSEIPPHQKRRVRTFQSSASAVYICNAARCRMMPASTTIGSHACPDFHRAPFESSCRARVGARGDGRDTWLPPSVC